MLYTHQKEIIKDDSQTCGLFLGCGGGKTRIALYLAQGKTLVVAPKTQVEDGNWEREKESLIDSLGVVPSDQKIRNLDLTVISKENFKKNVGSLPYYDTVIFDEAHVVCGATPNIRWRNKQPVPKCSQIFEAVIHYTEKWHPERLYLLTATPARNPMAVWALAKIMGKGWNFYKFRQRFYFQLPMPGREVWTPKGDEETTDYLAQLVRKLGYTGRLEDWFDVPDQIEKEHFVDLTNDQVEAMEDIEENYSAPIEKFGKFHQIENGILNGNEFKESERFKNNKSDIIMDYVEEFPKVLIFAKYIEQINMIADMLKKKKKKVLILTGSTKNRGELIRIAEKSKNCIVIAQSSISTGYGLPSFPCTVFASLSWSQVDLIQAKGRVQRADHIKKNVYVYIVTNGVDRDAYNKLQNKMDFQLKIYVKDK